MDKWEVGTLVAETRHETGYGSIYALSKASGVSSSVIRAIERGRSSPTIETLTRIFEPLGWHVRLVLEPPSQRTAAYRANVARALARDTRRQARTAAARMMAADGQFTPADLRSLDEAAQAATRSAAAAEAAYQAGEGLPLGRSSSRSFSRSYSIRRQENPRNPF